MNSVLYEVACEGLVPTYVTKASQGEGKQKNNLARVAFEVGTAKAFRCLTSTSSCQRIFFCSEGLVTNMTVSDRWIPKHEANRVSPPDVL